MCFSSGSLTSRSAKDEAVCRRDGCTVEASRAAHRQHTDLQTEEMVCQTPSNSFSTAQSLSTITFAISFK